MDPDVTAGIEIRPPWPDEIARLREFLPRSFQRGAMPALSVAIRGATGRLVAAAARVPPVKAGRPESLRWRLAAEKYRTAGLLAPLFAQVMAGARGAVRTSGFIDERSQDAAVLRTQGFVADLNQEVFELDAAAFYERLGALNDRLASRVLIPPDAQVAPLSDRWLVSARHLLAHHVPPEALEATDRPLLDAEQEGYRQDHSYVLLVGETVQGLLLSRYANGVIHVGAVLVAPELRGGHGWANFLLFHRARPDGSIPVKIIRFTADECLHPNSLRFARLWRARSVGRRVTLLRTIVTL